MGGEIQVWIWRNQSSSSFHKKFATKRKLH